MSMIEQSERAPMSDCTVLSFPIPHKRIAAVSHDWDLIDFLRTAALRARLEPQLEPERACALIAADPTVSALRHATAFFQALGNASIRDISLHHRGVRHATVDEDWLESLIAAVHRDDLSSASLMMRMRIKPLGRHRMFALTCGLAKAIERLDLSDRHSLAS